MIMIQALVVNFLTKDVWRTVPEEWRTALQNISSDNLRRLPTGDIIMVLRI
jgi:hypothetical protein